VFSVITKIKPIDSLTQLRQNNIQLIKRTHQLDVSAFMKPSSGFNLKKSLLQSAQHKIFPSKTSILLVSITLRHFTLR